MASLCFVEKCIFAGGLGGSMVTLHTHHANHPKPDERSWLRWAVGEVSATYFGAAGGYVGGYYFANAVRRARLTTAVTITALPVWAITKRFFLQSVSK